MKIKLIGTLATIVAWLGLTATPVLAASVHLKGGPGAQPTFYDNGLTLTASGQLVGLGNGNILITQDANGNPTATCTNPSGANQPPGQNPASVSVTGSQAIPSSQIKNGTVAFSVTTQPPASPIPGAPGCPSRHWTEAITDVAFTSSALNVWQGGADVFTIGCYFVPPTSNGAVSPSTVSCQ
jgi:hypothetical protein